LPWRIFFACSLDDDKSLGVVADDAVTATFSNAIVSSAAMTEGCTTHPASNKTSAPKAAFRTASRFGNSAACVSASAAAAADDDDDDEEDDDDDGARGGAELVIEAATNTSAHSLNRRRVCTMVSAVNKNLVMPLSI